MPDTREQSALNTIPAGHTEAEQAAALRAVLEVSRQLGATTELQPMLETIEGAARAVLNCERATVFLYDRKTDELYSQVATGVDSIRFPAGRGIAGETVRQSQVVRVPDAYADARFNPDVDRRTGFRTRDLLSVPLTGYDNSIVGVLQVLNKQRGAFDDFDVELVRVFGAQAGVAVQRQLLLEHFAEKQRLQHDLDIARSIQQALLPKAEPQVAGFDIAGWSKPADETGGDCYDFLALPDGSLALAIADATGHGIGPALVIAECRALLRAAVSLNSNLGEVVALVNRLLCEDLPDNRFVTAFFGLLAPNERRLAYLAAGHGPNLFFDGQTLEMRELPANGIPLGIMADVPFDDITDVAFRPGDMLLLFTDGFYEWVNPAKDQFGSDRILQLVRDHRDRTAREIIQVVYDAVIAFAEGTPQKDDLTAVIIKGL